MKRFLSSIALITCLLGFFRESLANLNVGPDWRQEALIAQDISVSHKGDQWAVGDDGTVSVWVESTEKWEAVRAPQRFKRIDAGASIVAGVAENGFVYLRQNSLKGRWVNTGIRANDVGIGGGYLWLSGVKNLIAGEAILRARLDGTLTDINWSSPMPGALDRLDVDPNGRAWGIDRAGILYVHADDQWIKDETAPPFADIGVGGNGTIYAVSKETVSSLGGGELYVRDPASSGWSKVPGRLSSVSVTPDGRPVGVNSLGWVIAGKTGVVAKENFVLRPGQKKQEAETQEPQEQAQVLADLVGDLEIPETIAQAPVTLHESENDRLQFATLKLNGLDTYAVVISHDDSDVPSLALAHMSMRITDYMPEASETGFAKLGQLNNPVFFFVHEDNADKTFDDDKLTLLQTVVARDDLSKEGYDAGITFHATTNGRDFGNVWAGGGAFDLGAEDIAISGSISPDIFKKVESRDTPPLDPALSLNDLKTIYGEELFNSGKLTAYIPSMEGRKVGPFSIDNHNVMIGWGEELEGEVTFALSIDYIKPELATAEETLKLDRVTARFNKNEKSVFMSGGLSAEKTKSIVDFEGLKHKETYFEGSFKVAEGTDGTPQKLADFEELSLSVISNLEIPTDGNPNIAPVAKLDFEPDEDKEYLIPTLYIESGMTLADIVGDRVPGADKISLTDVEASTNYIAGNFEIAGSPARAVLYQPDEDDKPAIVSIQHQSVDLGSYIPPIRKTQIGSFGLANANLFFLLNEEGREIEFEELDDVPEQLQPALQNGDYAGLFPLSIHKDVTIVGTYSPAEEGNAAAVMKAFGIEEKGYAVKGSFNFDQIKNAKPRKFDPRFTVNKKAACEAVTSVDLGGLDLSFNAGDIKVPEIQGAIEVKDATFRLKEVDGQIEPSMVAKVFFNFPDNGVMGLKNLSSMGMFSVQGDLNVLCNGPSADDDAKLAFVTSTEFNNTDLDDMSFASLDWVTGFGEPPEEEETGEAGEENEDATAEDEEFGKPIEGWKDPLGIPYLTIRHYASSGTFEQKKTDDGVKRTLSFQTWADAKVNKAEVNIWGDVAYEIKEDTLDVESWSLNIPDPIALADLPGLDKFPVAKDLTISNIDLSNEEMVGQLAWKDRGGVTAKGYIKFEEEEGEPTKTLLMAELNKVKPSWVTPLAPASILDTEFAPALIGWSNIEAQELAYDDAPEKLQPLLSSFIGEGETITVADGLTLAGRTSMEKLLDNEGVSLLREFATFEDRLVLHAALELGANDELTGEVSAEIAGFGLKNIPDGQLDFKNTELVLSNLDGNKIEVETIAVTKLPNDTAITTEGTLSVEKEGTKKSLSGSLLSKTKWSSPLGFSDFDIDAVAFNVDIEKDGDQTKREIGFEGLGRYKQNSGTVGISLASVNGKLEDKVITFEGDLTLSNLFSAPGLISNVGDAQISKMIYSTDATAFDTIMTIGGYQYNGRGAIVRDEGKHALFLRLDNTLAFNEIVSEIPKPLDALAIPKGLLIMGNQSVSDFDISGIPAQIHTLVFDGLWKEPISNTLEVDDGLTFLTRMNVDELPGTLKEIITSDPFNVEGDYTVGGSLGGIYGGDPSMGFYLQLDKTRPKVPFAVKQLIEPAHAAAKLFVKSEGADHSFSVGMASKAVIRSRRLDDPSVEVRLPTEFSIQYAQEANNPRPTVSLTAAVEGNWQDPFGLEGYALKDPSLTFGVTGEGVLVEVHTEEADFDGKKFVFDLATTWAGNVPTDLSLQFAKSPAMKELVLTPIDMLKLQKSIFDLAFKSGSALMASIKERSYLSLLGQLEKLGVLASDGTFKMLEKSPLSMVGVRDPFVYFGTPGSTPPARKGVERPPFGLGLIAQGELFIDLGKVQFDVAEGEYRVNLKDGYYVSGAVTPPPPFESSYFELTGAQPMLSPGLGKLRLEGSMKLPGFLIPGIPAEISGGFDFSRPGLMEPVVDIAGDISIGSGTIRRSAELHLNGTSLKVRSMPHGCIDVPVKIDGTIDAKSPDDALKLLTIAKPHLSVPDPLSCPEALVKIWENAIEIAKDPTKLAQDPLAAQKQMTDAAKLALSALPDNEVTQALYKGMDLANEATDAARDLAAEAINKVPGSQEAQKAMADAQKAAKQAVNQAMTAALDATGPVGEIGQQGFNMTKDIAMDGLNAMGDVFGSMLGGFSSAWNSFSGGKNYCNARIEYMRGLGTAHETKEKVDALWQRLNKVRVASLESEAVMKQWKGLTKRMNQARQGKVLWYLSDKWNTFAHKMYRPDLYMEHLQTYHKMGKGWVDGRPNNQQETYQMGPGFNAQELFRSYSTYLYRATQKQTLLDYVGMIKQFAETMNFHPGADYPGFRCQKMAIVQRGLDAMHNMGIKIRTWNTDHFNIDELNGYFNQVDRITNQINALNQNSLNRIALIQRLNVRRNVQYISDIYLSMMDVLNNFKKHEYGTAEPDEAFVNVMDQAENAIEEFYAKGIEVASLQGEPESWPDVVAKQKTVFARLNQVLQFTYALEVANLNKDWSSTSRMPTIVLPYAQKCLHSFYRPLDNANPFYIRDCNAEMQSALENIQSGDNVSALSVGNILKHVSVNAVTGETYIKDVLKYQFRLWYADETGAVRMSTAVSETHPNVDYCLGVPASLSPVVSESAIKAYPCDQGDETQLWKKVPDDGGPAFFRLQSLTTGRCATWRGTDGVDALILKDCDDAHKARQVMTAGWPFRQATHPTPRMRNSTGPKKYAFISTQSGQCITANTGKGTIEAISANKNQACRRVNHHVDVATRFEFTIEKVDNDNRRLVHGSGANRQCLVSKNTYVNEWSSEVEPDPAKGFRIVGLGACDGDESLWQFGPPGWDGWHEQRYTIREAFGKRQCLTRYVSWYYRDSYKQPMAFLLKDCKLQNLSSIRPDIKIRPEDQQFFPFEVR